MGQRLQSFVSGFLLAKRSMVSFKLTRALVVEMTRLREATVKGKFRPTLTI